MFHSLRDSLHATAWIAFSMLATPSAFAECGLGGDCCTTSSTAGCADAECCEAVCTMDPYCCSAAWDALCVQAAQQGCDSCGGAPLVVAAFGGSVTLPGGLAVTATDLAAFDPATGQWSLFFQGANVGLTKTISAATRLPDGDLLIATTANGSISGMSGGSSYTRNDLVRFSPTSLGADTAGSWAFHFDGSDVGLTTSGLAINSISVLADGSLVIGTANGGDIPGVGSVAPHDLIRFAPTSLGPNTAGSWSLHFDGSDVGLAASGNKLDAACVRHDGSILLSTNSTGVFQGFKAKSDLVLFEPTSLGEATAGALSYYLRAFEMGLDSSPNLRGAFLADVSRSGGGSRDGGGAQTGCGNGADCCSEHASPGCADAACCSTVCALDPFCCEVAWDEYCVMSATFYCEPCRPGPKVVVAFGASTTLPGGITVAACDLAQYDFETGEWSVYFRGANVGIGGRAIGAATVMPEGDLLISLTSSGTLAGLAGAPSGTSFTRNDILRFTPTLLGEETAGSWTFFFDGSDVGLSSSYTAIRSLALLEDGGIVIGCNTGGSLPGVGEFTGHDLVVFDATSLGAQTAGTFAPYFRGGDVGLTTNGERLDFSFVNTDGMLLLSTRGSFSATGNVSGLKGDLLAFFPDSLGDETAGDLGLFMLGIESGLPTSVDIRGGFVLFPVVPLMPRPDPGDGGDGGSGGGGDGGGGDGNGGDGGGGGDGGSNSPDFCGDPLAGDCCSVNETPFCNDADCCDAVCLIDVSCCSVAWDHTCADLAALTCAPCGNGGGGVAGPRIGIGGHGPDVNYYTASVGFANLTHSMNMFWSELNTADGWRHATGNYLFGVGLQSRLSMLGIQGSWDPINVSYQDQWTTEYGISENYRVRYKVTVYWEGSQGRAQVTERVRNGSDAAITNFAWPPQSSAAFSSATVQFANGDPFGEGVTRNFYKRTTQFGPVSVRGLKDHNLSVYANGSTDPLRNAIILVHDVQREVGASGSNVWETVYAGFTHENYTPFALYPTYVEAMKHLKTLRYLTFGWSHEADGMISQSTGEAITGQNYPYNDSWETAAKNTAYSQYYNMPPTFGTARGFGNLNRPTHVAFGRSLRAACEICSALGCDLWWNHPFHSTYVGNTPGEIKVREAYLQMFAETVNQHLAPGLKVYSEWGNETWNWSSPYYHGLRYAQNQGLKLTNANGDLVLRDYSSAWPSNPPWWANTAGNPNIAMFAYNAAAAAAISAYLRPLMPGRELVSVWASQDANGGVRAEIRQAAMALWETIPWVFDELDAYAVAPYRTPPVDSAAVEAGTLTTTAAFDAIQSAGWLLPAGDPSSRWYSTPGEWGSNLGKLGFVQQKQFSLDLVADPNPGLSFAMPDEQNKRRWNLRLIAYECGQHASPNTTATKDFTRRLQYEPRYYDFYYRHYETMLSPGPAPMTTTRQPDGYFGVKSQFIANGEPLYDMVCDLSPIGPHGFNNSGFFWGTQQFNGEIGAPRATALRQLVIDQPWSQT